MPTGCGVPLCPNRNQKNPVIRGRNLVYHSLPREEPLRSAWCRSIGREDPGKADVRVCSEHFNGDNDYVRIASVLRDAGQTLKRVSLKSTSVPSLRLPPFARSTQAKEPPSKRRRTLGDEPIGDAGCSEESAPSAPRELCCSCGHRPASHDAAVQVDPEEVQAVQAPTKAPRPPARKDRAVGTDPRLGKKSVGTQGNTYAKVVTTQSAQTEELELLGTASATTTTIT
ncbi:uncharacterized protein LOC115329270, partial [Ixodes scapularis]|uniref:uncharacterized protein LOC115329270 n=1 Tax=Ixodes scapularis TaxID=6945 RepID=UPI001C388DFE